MRHQICNWVKKYYKNKHLFHFLTTKSYNYTIWIFKRPFRPFGFAPRQPYRPFLSNFQTFSFSLSLTLNLNLGLIPDHFWPTSGPASAINYLERKLLRFQGLIRCITHIWVLLGCWDIIKKVKDSFFFTKAEIFWKLNFLRNLV